MTTEVKKEVKPKRHKVSQKCRVCHGVGYIEYEAGLAQIPCRNCKGTGSITKLKAIKEKGKNGNKVPIRAERADTSS